MCGIAGFITTISRHNAEIQIGKMCDVISHRGPDDYGIFVGGVSSCSALVALGHRRLSIIDLSCGHQPMSNAAGSIQVVFNGEIYNYKELRDSLIGLGYRFKTNSDTETIVYAYDAFGSECVKKFRGMFSLAIWDDREKCLFLARDRFGKKPLFLYHQGESLYFASEIKSILQVESYPKQVDRAAIWQYLSYRYVPAPNTLFAGIEKLMPGHCAVWKNGSFNAWPYYTPPDCKRLVHEVKRDDPVNEFLHRLDEAVKIRMVSDVPFGAFLSGGIDSSAIVGLMAKHSSLPVKTFSVGFSESAYSELGYARTIADQFNTEHHELTVSHEHLMDELPSLIRFRDAPVTEPSDIPIFLLAREARKTVKMVLTGEGSDEFLGGYPKHMVERYAKTYQHIPSFCRRGLIEPVVHILPYRFRRVKTAILNLGLEAWDERMARWFGALSSQERESLTLLDIGLNSYGWANIDVEVSNSPLRRILAFDQMSWLPDNLLERGDRMTMAASLEARMPFMDHELAGFISSLSDEMRIRGKTSKWILRQAMKQLLPECVLDRPKVGFRVPVNTWFQGPMRDYLYEHLLGKGSCTIHYYKRSELERLLAEHVKGRQNHEKLLWCLLNLELWHQEYNLSA